MKRMKWPTGKYNRQRIDGIEVKVRFHVLWWNWKPIVKYNFGNPYFHWLFVSIFVQLSYHHDRK